MDSAALIPIEMQTEWLASEGKLNSFMKDRELFEHSQGQARRALTAARSAGVPVAHVGLHLTSDHRELGSAAYGLRHAIAEAGIFVEGEVGSTFVDPFTPRADEFVASGRVGGSAFAGSNLDAYLRNNRLNRLYLMGYAAHVCVESTLRQGHDLGYDCIVLTDATAAFTRDQQRHFEEDVIHHFGAAITVDEFKREIGSGASSEV